MSHVSRFVVLSLPLIFFCSGISSSQTLLSDSFGGSGRVDQTKWRLPFGGDGSFLGRTQLKTNLATDYPIQTGGVARLRFDTYLDNGSGGSAGVFSGAEINTRRNFSVGGGLRFNARARVVNPPGGLAGGIFLFDVTRTNGSGDLVRDEIDHEIITNEIQPGGQRRVFTNHWNEGPFTGPGSGGFPRFDSLGAGFDQTQFHNYTIDWRPDRISWYVDNTLVRTTSTAVPDDPMNARINFWAPDSGWPDAFNAALQPAATAGANQQFFLEVDDVSISRQNTTLGPNLLVDPSFENGDLIIDPVATGGWFQFANAFEATDVVRTGFFSAKAFGPFDGSTNASGIFQNVVASPGDVFEASAFASTTAADTIAGTSNFVTVKIEFLNAAGAVIGGNQKETIILNGQDPDMPEDQWVEGVVNAVAPAGTTKARVVLPFIQFAQGIRNPPNQDPGAVWFDDVSFRRIISGPSVDADFNNDGLLNCTDVDSLTQVIANGSNLPSQDLTGDGIVNGVDLDLWLAIAGETNLPSGNPYLKGDANLDGQVDGSDFGIWNANKFTNRSEWCRGDFNANGVVDGSDFGIWNANKFRSSDTAVVPEPGLAASSLCLALGVLALRARR